MAILTLYDSDEEPTYVDASAGGDQYLNAVVANLIAVNSSGSPITLTFVGQTPVLDHPDQPLIHRVIVLDAVSSLNCPYASARWFNDAGGYVQVTYSSVVGLQVAAVKQELSRW